MRIFLTAFLVFFLIASPAYARDTVPVETREKIFNAESFTLQNGMRVVVIPNHRVPVITHMVWYNVGAADEIPGQSGLAHFVEHLMFKGTKDIPPGEFSKRVKAMGGNDNAFTSQDFTAYFQSIAVDHLETVMKMEADRMTNLTFDPANVDSERLVVIEERRQRTENEPTGYFYEQMRTLLFPNHPYGNPVIGWLHEMEALNRDNVKELYSTWYAPNNATLVVSGDITADELKPLAEKIYGVIPARTVPERHWTAVPPLLAKPRLILHHPDIHQSSLIRVYRVPSLAVDKQKSLALEILTDIMGGGSTSRLYKSLVVDQKIAASASFRYDNLALSETTLQITATPAAGKTLEDLETAVNQEIKKLVTDGVSTQEVAEAKKRLAESAILARDSIVGPAMLFGRVLTSGGTIDDLEYWPYDMQAITREQINDVAKHYLDEEALKTRPYVTGYILPEEQQEGSE